MEYEQILFAKAEGVATVTLNRPDKLNAFTFRMLDEINDALSRETGVGTRAVVIRGAGRAFSAGDDLTGMGGTRGLDDMRRGHHGMIKRIRALRVPVVAAIHGYALGAAFDLALACDFRLAAESAQLGDVRVNRAMNSMSGAAFWLPRYVGVGRASEILMLGERLGAARCLEWGIVTRVFPDTGFEAGIAQFVESLRALPTKVLGANKALLNFGLESHLAAALDTEGRELLESFRTEDFREGAAAWAEKRAPRYSGR
jgi:2-(1,2-epoxy-1,2-dihydrophenyl)acetyl-CoA isomerase